jgi:uncharacterized protein YbjT (DUF2867 family)/membrane protease YdiL (CAAX protease family)
MRIAVAGGTGFVGRHVVEALSARGHTVLVLARGERARTPGAVFVRCDLARGPVPDGALAGCDAVVNLAGIKRASGTQTFEGVHVTGTERLLEGCRLQGVRRFVHLSVVCSRPDAASPYHDTKWRGEERVRASGLDATILKPGVIYGPGDDMVTHLVKMIRFAAVFPLVGRGASLLQPVDVRDVAEAVAAALTRPQSIGRTYDVVGPERHTLAEVVRTVAQATGLPLAIVPTPLALQRVAVRAMDALTKQPLSTPSQLRMLIDGLYGDPEPARRDLGLVPRPFTVGAVLRLAGAIPPLFGFSLRLVRHRSQGEWLARRGRALAPAVVLAIAAPLVQLVLAQAIPNVWYRMGAGAVLLSTFAWTCVPVGWRELFRPRPRDLVRGAAAAALLYAAGALVVRVIVVSPGLAAQMDDVYGWRHAVPDALAVPLLLLIVLGEEIVWRAAITLPLAARIGPWAGVVAGAVAFAVAHLPLGMPVLLLAALGAGAFWSALAIKTRSLVPALVSHVLWDLAVLFALPYAIAPR